MFAYGTSTYLYMYNHDWWREDTAVSFVGEWRQVGASFWASQGEIFFRESWQNSSSSRKNHNFCCVQFLSWPASQGEFLGKLFFTRRVFRLVLAEQARFTASFLSNGEWGQVFKLPSKYMKKRWYYRTQKLLPEVYKRKTDSVSWVWSCLCAACVSCCILL